MSRTFAAFISLLVVFITVSIYAIVIDMFIMKDGSQHTIISLLIMALAFLFFYVFGKDYLKSGFRLTTRAADGLIFLFILVSAIVSFLSPSFSMATLLLLNVTVFLLFLNSLRNKYKNPID